MEKFIGLVQVLISSIIFIYLIYKYPIRITLKNKYQNHGAFSAYGVLSKTKLLFDSTLFINGVLTIIVYRYYWFKYDLPVYMLVVFVLTGVGMIMAALIHDDNFEDYINFKRAFHLAWAFVIVVGIVISTLILPFYLLAYTQFSIVLIFLSFVILLIIPISVIISKFNKYIVELCVLIPFGIWVICLSLIDILILK